jgi:hypothetical protein
MTEEFKTFTRMQPTANEDTSSLKTDHLITTRPSLPRQSQTDQQFRQLQPKISPKETPQN